MLNDDERRLQAELDETRLVALLTELVRRPSVSGEEKPAVEHLAGFLGDHGLAVELTEAAPGRPNLVCRWGADDGPTLLLTGHSDTVPIGNGWSRDPFGAADRGRPALRPRLLRHEGRPRRHGPDDGGDQAGLREAEGQRRVRRLRRRGSQRHRHAGRHPRRPARRLGGHRRAHGTAADPRLPRQLLFRGRDRRPRAPMPARPRRASTRSTAPCRRSPPPSATAPSWPAAATRCWASPRSASARSPAAPASPWCPTSATSGSIAGCCRARPASRRSPTFAPRCSGTCRPRTSCAARNGCAWSCRPRRSTATIRWWPRWRRRRRDSGAPALPVGGWSAASDGGYLMRDAGIPTVLFGPGSIVNQAHRADESVPLDEVIDGRAHLPDHGGANAGRPASQRSAVIRIAARHAHQRQIKRRPGCHAALRQERISGPHPPHQGAHGRRAASRCCWPPIPPT